MGITHKFNTDKQQLVVKLVQASREGDQVRVKQLIAGGADVNGSDGHSCALHVADNNIVTRVLLDAGARIDIPDADGSLPQHRAAQNGHSFSLQMLLAAPGAVVDSVDKYGATALCEAARYGRIDAVNVLLKHGAKTDITDETGRTPQQWAVENRRLEIAVRLQEHTMGTGQAVTVKGPLQFRK
mgnify:CR=1 FL=1